MLHTTRSSHSALPVSPAARTEMAHHFSCSPSSASKETHLLCNPLSAPSLLKLTPFRPALPLKRFSYSSLKLYTLSPHYRLLHHIARISVQGHILGETENSISSQVANTRHSEEKSSFASKSYIWINPRSPRASQLRKQSYDARCSSLVAIAESLSSCNSIEEDVFGLLVSLGDKIVEQDAVVVLNSMLNPETAVIGLKYFQQKLNSSKEVILYNVTLKVFRKSRDLQGAENLFGEMLQRVVKPDNVTFSTINSCARLSSLAEKAVEWYETMPVSRPDSPCRVTALL